VVHRIQTPTNVFDANAQSEEHLQSLDPIVLAPAITMEDTETFLGTATTTWITQLDVSKSYKDDSKQLWHIELDQHAAEEVEAKVLQNVYKKVKVIESAQAILSYKIKAQKQKIQFKLVEFVDMSDIEMDQAPQAGPSVPS
jgi:hypothetical protein